jgi:hypothetical protein
MVKEIKWPDLENERLLNGRIPCATSTGRRNTLVKSFGILEPRQQFTEEVDRILSDPAIKSALN